MTTERPAHREPMVWLMIALPAAAVLAGLLTLAIAIRADRASPAPARPAVESAAPAGR